MSSHDTPPEGWRAESTNLEELVLAYLRSPDASALDGPHPGGITTGAGAGMTAVALSPTRTTRRGRGLRGLPWVTWRQHRVALLTTVGLFAGLAVFLVAYGLSMHSAFSKLGLTTCGPLTGPACQAPLNIFEQRYQGAAMYLPRFLEFVPALLGAFIGAPMVARELESGTYRFAWTQGRNRVRWLAVKLTLISGLLVAVGLGFSALFSWWFQPWEPIMGRLAGGESYEITGVVFAARILFGLCLGVALGTIIRRTVPAMLATIAVWLAVAWPSVVFLRPLIQTPISVPTASNSIADNAWAISTWYQNSSGRHLGSAGLDRLLAQARASGVTTGDAFQAFLGRHGWTQWSSYEPNSRFWHFQTVEAAAYVLLSLALAALALWWIDRRAA